MTTDERLLNCTSSESPNKSSGDIGELKPCPFCGNTPVHAYSSGIFCVTEECVINGVHCMDPDEWNTRAPDPESAAEIERRDRLISAHQQQIIDGSAMLAAKDAEIERLRRERDEAVKREQYAIRWANASVDSVKEVVDVELADLKSERDRIARNRDMWKGQVDRQADRIRRLQPNALTAESAVAAAWGEAAKIVEVPCQFETRMVNGEILVSLVELQRIIHDRASAIRAAGAGKTAESGDSHSKCRRKNLDERGIGTE